MKLLSEIIIFIIGWTIILLASGFILAGNIQDPEEESICKFPCSFQGPVYHLAVRSAKHEWIKNHGRSF